MSRPARARHIHLGTRLATVERIRRGEVTSEAAADELGVPVEQLYRWLELHAATGTGAKEEPDASG